MRHWILNDNRVFMRGHLRLLVNNEAAVAWGRSPGEAGVLAGLGLEERHGDIQRLTFSHRREATGWKGNERPVGTEPGPARAAQQDRGHWDNETRRYSEQHTPGNGGG